MIQKQYIYIKNKKRVEMLYTNHVNWTNFNILVILYFAITYLQSNDSFECLNPSKLRHR